MPDTTPNREESWEKDILALAKDPDCHDMLLGVVKSLLSEREKKYVFPEHKASLHVTHNQHKAYYQSIEDYIAEEEIGKAEYEWATPTSKERAIATDSLWEVQWYPDTPIGFCLKYGATLEEILASLAPQDKEEGKK